jgi:DNA repair/transcription protein MET18/MMS19
LNSLRTDLNPEALRGFSGDAVQVMVRALVNAPKSEVSFRLASLNGLVQLASIPKVLSEEEKVLTVDTITEIVLHERIEGHGDIRTQAVKALTDLAHSTPDDIRSRTVPAFMVELPDVPTDSSIPLLVLEAFAQLSSERQIFDTVVLRLKNKFTTARHQSAPMDYQRALLLALLYAFTFGDPTLENGVLRSDYFTEYAEPLIFGVVEAEETDKKVPLLEIVGRIVNVTLRPQSIHFQSTVYHNHPNITSKASSTSEKGSHISTLAPFTLYYYAALRPEVVEPEDILGLLQAQSRLALDSTVPRPTALTVLRHMSLMANKFLNPKTMRETLDSCNLEMEKLLADQPSPAAAELAFAVTKSLLVQGKSAALTNKYLQSLVELLAQADKPIARCFVTLLAPDDILTKENHCLVTGLYKQKVFNQVVPRITESIKTADASTKPNYLIALSGILRWLPYSILEPSLPSLTAPLLQTLDLNDLADQEVKASALTIFESVLMHNPSVVAEHTASLITRLLNCTAATSNNAAVRAKALQCLALVPKQLKREAVVPYRRQVVKRLLNCLDDAKRSVRSEAVRCRTAWLGLDEGNDDED